MKLPRNIRMYLRRVAAYILPPIYKIWAATLRIEEIDREPLEKLVANGERIVICLWHGETFAFWKLKRQIPLVAIVSKSRDGEFLARVVTKFGFHLARGSSSKGGAEALRAVVKAMRQGYCPCITVDGPRGPLHDVKDGVFFMSKLGNGWLVPARALYTYGITFNNAWDKFFMPLPFSKIRVAFGEPYKLNAEKLDEETLQAARQDLKQKMNALEAQRPKK